MVLYSKVQKNFDAIRVSIVKSTFNFIYQTIFHHYTILMPSHCHLSIYFWCFKFNLNTAIARTRFDAILMDFQYTCTSRIKHIWFDFFFYFKMLCTVEIRIWYKTKFNKYNPSSMLNSCQTIKYQSISYKWNHDMQYGNFIFDFVILIWDTSIRLN